MIKAKVEFMTSNRTGGVNAVEVSFHEGTEVIVIEADKVKVWVVMEYDNGDEPVGVFFDIEKAKSSVKGTWIQHHEEYWHHSTGSYGIKQFDVQE